MKKSPLFLIIGVGAVIYGVMLAYAGITETIAEAHGAHTQSNLLPALLGFLPLIFVALIFSFWVSALVDMLQNTAIQGTEKIVWVLVIIFLNVLGAIIYFFIAPRPKLRLNLSAPARGRRLG